MPTDTGTSPLHRRPSNDRITAARPFLGKRVVVTIDNRNMDQHEYVGTLIAACALSSGTVTDVLVLRGADRDHAWSLAVVRGIRLAPGSQS